jgi:serine/threonine protein kinase
MIVIPYIKNTLEDFLLGGFPLSEAFIKNVAYQIADGMFYLHNNGIFHKDLRSRNILVSRKNFNFVLSFERFALEKLTNVLR